MSTDTANYGFTKDNEDDFYNVNVVNANLDKIDTEMKRIEDAIQPISPTDSVKWLGTVGGTVNALTATHVEITSYSDGLGVSFAANANSSAAATLNINSLGAIPIKKADGTAFSNAKANGVYTVRYRAGAFILQGESEVEIGKQIITPSTTNQTILKGLHDGSGYVKGDANLIPSNIIKDINIFGVLGSINPAKIATGLVRTSNFENKHIVFSISAPFNPKVVILYQHDLNALFHTSNDCPNIPGLTYNIRAGGIKHGVGYSSFINGFYASFLVDNYQVYEGEYRYLLIG
ncbi:MULTISPECIES: hypothetical protein [unclassified Lysinibacillus]|uniref:hypothetical protein n=1 Tax=unclassified Lysinibacillus TaxID=2636778 RepID=UPI0008862147|nr:MULTISPECIES: hypothetical protein [unclassified Lysinibacillus]SCX93869.1 hypothetical protein SAMN02787078_00551 [Lysinibacillus sp. SG9]SDB07112.1 hypothetical protein SAMN02787079_00550 [Lysinibacillus sp. TC-37]SFS39067.1 hypothetical protein SAMN02787087_00555 [Lysinibacillus sp. SG55]